MENLQNFFSSMLPASFFFETVILQSTVIYPNLDFFVFPSLFKLVISPRSA